MLFSPLAGRKIGKKKLRENEKHGSSKLHLISFSQCLAVPRSGSTCSWLHLLHTKWSSVRKICGKLCKLKVNQNITEIFPDWARWSGITPKHQLLFALSKPTDHLLNTSPGEEAALLLTKPNRRTLLVQTCIPENAAWAALFLQELLWLGSTTEHCPAKLPLTQTAWNKQHILHPAVNLLITETPGSGITQSRPFQLFLSAPNQSTRPQPVTAVPSTLGPSFWQLCSSHQLLPYYCPPLPSLLIANYQKQNQSVVEVFISPWSPMAVTEKLTNSPDACVSFHQEILS